MAKKIIVIMMSVLVFFLMACDKDESFEEQSLISEEINSEQEESADEAVTIVENEIIDEEESGYASLAAAAYMTGMALKNKDYGSLAQLAHPVSGVRFSINGKVEPETDVVLSIGDFQKEAIGSNQYNWGVEDGSPEPMMKSVDVFMDRFNQDFENPERNGWNERVTGYGIKDQPESGIQLIEGGESIYAGCEFVEYYFEGPSGQEFDWNSYILIFEKYQEKYYLAGILHNYWLI